MWVLNLILVRNKCEDIHLCVDFWNLNKASDKDNYLVPSIKKILQMVLKFELFPLLDGLSSYN